MSDTVDFESLNLYIDVYTIIQEHFKWLRFRYALYLKLMPFQMLPEHIVEVRAELHKYQQKIVAAEIHEVDGLFIEQNVGPCLGLAVYLRQYLEDEILAFTKRIRQEQQIAPAF